MLEEIEKAANNLAKYPPRPPAPASAGGVANGTSASEHNASSRPPPIYSDGSKVPIIVCGDFNSIQNSGIYEFLTTGSLPPDHPDFLSHLYGKYTSEGLRHKLNLKSAYSTVGEIPFTNITPGFRGVIDYILFSTSNLSVNAVLGEVDKQYIEKVVGFPNVHFPSEYVLFCCLWLWPLCDTCTD